MAVEKEGFQNLMSNMSFWQFLSVESLVCCRIPRKIGKKKKKKAN